MIISSKQIGELLKLQSGIKPKESEHHLSSAPLQGKDEVAFSSRASEVSRIRNLLLKDVPDVRTERVEEIAAALAKGEYRIAPSDVAEKMVGRLLADRLK